MNQSHRAFRMWGKFGAKMIVFGLVAAGAILLSWYDDVLNNTVHTVKSGRGAIPFCPTVEPCFSGKFGGWRYGFSFGTHVLWRPMPGRAAIVSLEGMQIRQTFVPAIGQHLAPDL